MKKLLIFAAFCELATGLILLAYPAIVSRLLLGEVVAGAGVPISRVAGIALIALGIACWPEGSMRRAFYGMFTYGALIAVYAIILGASGHAGVLLWPAVAFHAGLSGPYEVNSSNTTKSWTSYRNS
jgi:hypothetical protein